MNADTDGTLSDWDRYSLVIPDYQVRYILSQCRFPNMNIKCLLPGSLDEDPTNDFQRQFIEQANCMVCK